MSASDPVLMLTDECGWCRAKAADGADLLPLLDEWYCRDGNACASRRADGRADR